LKKTLSTLDEANGNELDLKMQIRDSVIILRMLMSIKANARRVLQSFNTI